MRYPSSILTLADFDPSAYRELRAKIADQGLEIVSLSELADVDWEKVAPLTLKRVRQ